VTNRRPRWPLIPWLESDAGLKLLAGGSAFLLWLQAVGHRDPAQERTYTGLTVRYAALDADLAMIASQPPAVNLAAWMSADAAEVQLEPIVDLKLPAGAHPVQKPGRCLSCSRGAG